MRESEVITLDSVIVRRNDLVSEELSDSELVMLNIERRSYYGMHETARVIWNLLDRPRSVGALCEQLLTRFAVDRETCEREVLDFVNDMLNNELIHAEHG